MPLQNINHNRVNSRVSPNESINYFKTLRLNYSQAFSHGSKLLSEEYFR